MPQAAQLVAKVAVEGDEEAKKKLSDVSKKVDDTSGGFKSMLKNALSFAGGLGIFNLASQAVGFLKDQFTGAIQESMDAQAGMAQTLEVIKSTGGAAGMTAQQIADMAGSLSHMTTFSDDAIQSGENLLLTFTGIGKDVFPLATKTLLDMSQAMHTDVKSSAIELGKALNDPAQGLTVLTRVGVTFTDKQKEMIQQMVAVGNVSGAQKIMLQELQREFGGSAVAAGKTFGGQLTILQQRLSDVKQGIGDALMPILKGFVDWVSSTGMSVLERFGNWFSNTAVPAIQRFGTFVGNVFTYVSNVLKSIDLTDFKDAWNAVGLVVQQVEMRFGKLASALHPIKGDFDPLADAIAGLAKGGLSLVSGLLWDISGAFIAVDKSLQSGKGPLIDIGNTFKSFAPDLKAISSVLTGQFKDGFKFSGDAAKQFGDWFSKSVMPALKDATPGFLSLAHTLLGNVVPALVNIHGVAVDVVEHGIKTFGPILGQIIPPLIRFAGILAKDLSDGLKFIMPYIKDATKAIGKFADEVMDRVAPIIKDWLSDMSKKISEFQKAWAVIWPSLSQILKGVWDTITGVVKVAWALVTGIIKIGLDLLSGNWKKAWTDLKNMLGGIWDGIKQSVHGAIDTISSIFGGLPAKALQWGQNIISSLADGITNSIGKIGSAIGSVTQFISDHLPHSPAKIGPLRELHLQGSMIADQMGQGMLAGLPRLQSAIGQLVKPIALNLNPTSSSFGGGLGSSSYQLSPMQASNQTQIVVQAPPIYLDGRLLSSGLMPHIANQVRYGLGTHN